MICKHCGQLIIGGKGDWFHKNPDGTYGDMTCRGTTVGRLAEPSPDAVRCMWDIAWVGQCKKEALPGTPALCAEHSDKTCVSCGRVAVRECPEAGSLVCGYPLCADCHHSGSGHSRTARWKPDAQDAQDIPLEDCSTTVEDLRELLVELEEEEAHG
jgi:hypothetical protein